MLILKMVLIFILLLVIMGVVFYKSTMLGVKIVLTMISKSVDEWHEIVDLLDRRKDPSPTASVQVKRLIKKSFNKLRE